MRYNVFHKTEYIYDIPVFLEPHIIKLFPESNIYQTVRSFDILVEPTPFAMSRQVGAMKNSVVRVWFEGLTEKLIVKTSFEVEVLRKNPYDFLTDPYAQNLKFSYEDKLIPYLTPFLNCETSSSLVKDFTDKLVKDAKYDTNMFLLLLNEKIKEICKYEVREHGEPNQPEKTLLAQKGSCRDFTVLFIQCTRSVGIASRFVSGYLYNPEVDKNYLHAWAEVYLPGGGWRGYDPTQGMAVGENHISLCSVGKAPEATPICGSYRSATAKSEMLVDIAIKPI